MNEKPLWKVDFHCHTIYSPDSLSDPARLVKRARACGLDRLVITDHNTIRGALAAQQIDPELVIVGEEVLTTRGELLAAFVKEEIPRGLAPKEAIARLREQGAFISVSHPFDLMRHGWELPDLLDIIPWVDAIEIFNARCLRMQTNEQALVFAREQGVAGTVGSDAHLLREVGAASLIIGPFSTPEELRGVIAHGQPQARLLPFWVHWGSVFARVVKATRKNSGKPLPGTKV